MSFNSRLDSSLPATLRSAQKGPGKRETAAICRERSAADLLQSVALMTVHERERMEGSSAVWAVRAEMLQRVEDGLARRTPETASLIVGDKPESHPVWA